MQEVRRSEECCGECKIGYNHWLYLNKLYSRAPASLSAELPMDPGQEESVRCS